MFLELFHHHLKYSPIVPQAFVLQLLLFNVFINDLYGAINYLVFADDIII
jgi:hypothetical protein